MKKKLFDYGKLNIKGRMTCVSDEVINKRYYITYETYTDINKNLKKQFIVIDNHYKAIATGYVTVTQPKISFGTKEDNINYICSQIEQYLDEKFN